MGLGYHPDIHSKEAVKKYVFNEVTKVHQLPEGIIKKLIDEGISVSEIVAGRTRVMVQFSTNPKFRGFHKMTPPVTPPKKRKIEFSMNANGGARGAYNPNSKEVRQYDKNGNMIAEYPSIRQAERETNIDYRAISRCSNGKRRSAGGFIWEFIK